VLPGAPASPALAVPEKPIELTPLKKDLAAIPAPSQVSAQRTNVVLPNQASAPAVALPAQVAAVETRGPDQQNLLSISPLPAPPQQSVRVPAAEARGRFGISPEPNLTASTNTPGVKADNVPTTTPGVGKKTDGPPSPAPAPDTAASTGRGEASRSGAGDGKSAGGGDGSGNTPVKSPFPGIAIQGGRLESRTGVSSGSTPSRTATVTAPKPRPADAQQTAYGMTIVSSAGSGGGLPDLGVFAREQVYTVYLDMKDAKGAAAPSWTMQYALVPAPASPTSLTPPFPIVKEPPNFPTELVRKYVRQLVVMYAVIDAQGKLQQVSVKQSPDPLLNQPALAALSKWTFRPAQVNGSPVSVKILVGIPVSLP